MIYAPVLIPTLNRHVHLKRCIDSLTRCIHAEKTDLFVALDYPLKEEHWDGYEKIREYLKTVTGFKSLNIIERDVNFGASKNIRDARETIYQIYDRMILSEDDNEFAPGFLEFVNKGLEVYESHDDVIAVCGYSIPIAIPIGFQQDFYFSKAFIAWGYGAWRGKSLVLDRDLDSIRHFLMNPRYAHRLGSMAFGVFNGLVAGVINDKVAGDRLVSYNNLRFDRFCLYPITSLVRNHGHDGSGIHCGRTKRFIRQNIDAKTDFDIVQKIVRTNPDIEKECIKHEIERVRGLPRYVVNLLKGYIKLLLAQKKASRRHHV